MFHYDSPTDESNLWTPGLLICRYPSSSGYFSMETFGSPKFPSYPFESMPWSQTPAVTSTLAMAHQGLLPSACSTASAFSCFHRIIHCPRLYRFRGSICPEEMPLGYTAWILAPSSFVLRLPGLHVDFATELVANLCSDGTFALAITHWITITNFIPIYGVSQGLGLTLAREALGYAVNARNTLRTQINGHLRFVKSMFLGSKRCV